MAPRLAQRGWHATLFVYPSAVSNARHAMRWEELRSLAAGGGFDVESHTCWHANLVQERRLRARRRTSNASPATSCCGRGSGWRRN